MAILIEKSRTARLFAVILLVISLNNNLTLGKQAKSSLTQDSSIVKAPGAGVKHQDPSCCSSNTCLDCVSCMDYLGCRDYASSPDPWYTSPEDGCPVCPTSDPCPGCTTPEPCEEYTCQPCPTTEPCPGCPTAPPPLDSPKFVKLIYQSSLPSWPIAGTTVHLGLNATTEDGAPVRYQLVTSFEFMTLSSANDIIFISNVSDGAYVGPNNVMVMEVLATVIGDESRSDSAAIVIVFPRSTTTNDNPTVL